MSIKQLKTVNITSLVYLCIFVLLWFLHLYKQNIFMVTKPPNGSLIANRIGLSVILNERLDQVFRLWLRFTFYESGKKILNIFKGCENFHPMNKSILYQHPKFISSWNIKECFLFHEKFCHLWCYPRTRPMFWLKCCRL